MIVDTPTHSQPEMPRPPEHPVAVLTLAKDARRTVLTVGPTPIGPEIRAMVDGSFAWSRICKTSAELQEELGRIHAEFLGLGWSEVTSAQA